MHCDSRSLLSAKEGKIIPVVADTSNSTDINYLQNLIINFKVSRVLSLALHSTPYEVNSRLQLGV